MTKRARKTQARMIKKYSNRRLYDMQARSYITLAEIKKLVIEEVDFKIIDAKTKKDLTQLTLLQIISEQENSATPIFTTPMLRDFIRFYHDNTQELVSAYLIQAMESFNQQKSFLMNQWENYQSLILQPFAVAHPTSFAISGQKKPHK